MYSPIPHDLTNYRFESNNDPFDFERNGFCPHQWEISVPQKNCIIWGTVLSYLKSTDFTVQGKFEERLNRLTENAIDTEIVKAAILDYNPFFNIHKCFFEETLQSVSQTFKKVLNENRAPGTAKTVAADLKLISTLLKSNILIVDLGQKELHLVTPSDGNCANVAAMTFICREYWNKEGKKPVLMKRFTFSLSKDLCWELRVEALGRYLESSDIRDVVVNEIQQMNEKEEKKINILIALLKKNLTYVISELYDSSYIVAKLVGAGFETDPRVLYEEKFSAFYYALQSNDNNLVYILYRYAANDCYESVNTVRDPNNSIISNLSKLKEILEGDCEKSNNFEEFGDKAEQARVTYHDLLRFNEFLIQVCCGIIDIREQPDGSSLEEATKQKDIILHILDRYDAFFSVGQLDFIQISEEELIENYTGHKIYYDNLDFTVALLFFDNIFRLKSILKSPKERLYSDLESIFVLSVIANKHFTTDAKKWIKIQDFDSDLIFNKLFIIPILERLNLRKEVKYFCSVLSSKVLVEDDIRERIPPEEIDEVLSNFPKLKDEFLISRLDRYLKTALETASKGMKQKFAIQRALQVIGESIKDEGAESSSIRQLLWKCLADDSPEGSKKPSDALETLKKIRNTLSHLSSFQFLLKFETEEDDNLFKSIQSEIKNIREEFKKIFDIQKIRLEEFLIHRGLESLQQFQQNKNISTDIHCLVQPLKNFEKKLRTESTDLEFELAQKRTDGGFVVPDIDDFHRRLLGRANKDIKKEILHEFKEKSPEVKTRAEAIKKLEKDLESGITLTLDRFDCLFLKNRDIDHIKKEYMELQSEAERGEESSKKEKLLHKIKKSPNPLNTLELIFDKKKVSYSQLNFLKKMVPFSDKNKSTLNSLIKISKMPRGDNLENLLNRIKHLYQISIEEQYDIRFLFEKAKSSKAKQHLVYKIVQRYFRESSFQAPLEMLFFDCVGIFKKSEGHKEKNNSKGQNNVEQKNVRTEGENSGTRKGGTREENGEDRNKEAREENNEDRNNESGKGSNEDRNKGTGNENNGYRNKGIREENNVGQKKKIVKEESPEDQYKKSKSEDNYVNQSIWLKDSYLFNGIDVRNVLAHGDPLLESIGNILDPKDLPSELVKKTLQLIEDQDCIKAFYQLWQKAKQSCENLESSLGSSDLRPRILLCRHWKQYSKLLLEDPKDSKVYVAVVLFLKKDQECIDALFQLWQRAKQSCENLESSLECRDKLRILLCRHWKQYSKLLVEDPKDSKASDAVVSILQKDQECVDALHKLWQKAKQSCENLESSLECRNLKRRILLCRDWKQYSELVVEDPKDSKAYDAVVSFLQKGPEPKKMKGRNSNSESSGN